MVNLSLTLSFFSTQVVSVASFNGGNNLDMIPDTVVLGGTFRAFSNTSFYQLLQRIKEVCHVTNTRINHTIVQYSTKIALPCLLKIEEKCLVYYLDNVIYHITISLY